MSITMRSDVTTRPVTPAGDGLGARRSRPMLAVLLMGQFMGLLDVYIVNVAMPTIGADLHTSGAALQLVVGGYTIGYAMFLITGARLGDLYGRRRIFHLGVIGFTVSSLVCGLAPDIWILVFARFAQGAAAAIMVPQIISVIQMRFTGKARAKALSTYAAVLSTGCVAGLVLGGVLIGANLLGAGWRPVFLVNVPIGIVLTALVPRVVPADRPSGGRRLDVTGLAIVVPAVVLVVVPLILGREFGWPAWTFACMAAGGALAVVFVAVERRVAAAGGDPLLDLTVLRARGLASGLTTLFFLMLPYGGFMFVFTMHLQAGLGDSAMRAALIFVPFAVTFGLVSFYWRALPGRLQPVLPLAGLLICAVSLVGLAAALRGGAQGGPLLWAALIGFGAGIGVTFSLITHSLVNVPKSQAADASGLLVTTVQLGQLIGVAAGGTVFLSLARHLSARSTAGALSSAHAIATTEHWMIVPLLIGMATVIPITRTLRRRSA